MRFVYIIKQYQQRDVRMKIISEHIITKMIRTNSAVLNDRINEIAHYQKGIVKSSKIALNSEFHSLSDALTIKLKGYSTIEALKDVSFCLISLQTIENLKLLTLSESNKIKDGLDKSISDLKTEVDSLSMKLPHNAKSSIKRKFTIDGANLVRNYF